MYEEKKKTWWQKLKDDTYERYDKELDYVVEHPIVGTLGFMWKWICICITTILVLAGIFCKGESCNLEEIEF